MTSLVIRYNVYILKDPKNFMNVDNCIIVQLQTKDQLMMDNTGIKARRAVVPFIWKSKKDIYLVPEVWRSIFWKVKRIYILLQKYGGRYVAKVKRIYILFQMYGGRYFGK